MSLHNEIQTLMGELGAKVPQEMMEKVGALIGRLTEEGVAKNARKVGDIAPSFALRNTEGELVTLDGLRAKGPVVVTFFRGQWCPFCDLELRAYQKALPEITARGATIVAISPQSVEPSRATAQDRGLGFDVLSDPGNALARSFGIVFSLNAAEQDLHKDFGVDLPMVNAADTWDLPVPATFVITPSGRIAWAHVDPNYTMRGEPADVLKAIDALHVVQ